MGWFCEDQPIHSVAEKNRSSTRIEVPPTVVARKTDPALLKNLVDAV